MNIKVTFFLFGVVLFLTLGVRSIWNSDTEHYVSELRNKAKLVTFTIKEITCNPKVRTGDLLEITAKENGVTLYAYIDRNIKCKGVLRRIKIGQRVSSHVDVNSREMMSIKVNEDVLLNLDKHLNERKEHYVNSSAIYFVIAFIFIMLFINERKESDEKSRNIKY